LHAAHEQSSRLIWLTLNSHEEKRIPVDYPIERKLRPQLLDEVVRQPDRTLELIALSGACSELLWLIERVWRLFIDRWIGVTTIKCETQCGGGRTGDSSPHNQCKNNPVKPSHGRDGPRCNANILPERKIESEDQHSSVAQRDTDADL
jgi:hypothetical protein